MTSAPRAPSLFVGSNKAREPLETRIPRGTGTIRNGPTRVTRVLAREREKEGEGRFGCRNLCRPLVASFREELDHRIPS